MEATESPEVVLRYYDDLLKADNSNNVGQPSVFLIPAPTQHILVCLEEENIGLEADGED